MKARHTAPDCELSTSAQHKTLTWKGYIYFTAVGGR
jgi:hypothetical protein